MRLLVCVRVCWSTCIRVCVCVCVSGGPENDVWVYCSCAFLCFFRLTGVVAHWEAMFGGGLGCVRFPPFRDISGEHRSRKKIHQKTRWAHESGTNKRYSLEKNHPCGRRPVRAFRLGCDECVSSGKKKTCHRNVFHNGDILIGVWLVLSSWSCLPSVSTCTK